MKLDRILRASLTWSLSPNLSTAGNDESGVVEGPTAEMTKANEVLRVQFENVKITEGPSLGINMVDLNQPCPQMEEVEKCLEMEK